MSKRCIVQFIVLTQSIFMIAIILDCVAYADSPAYVRFDRPALYPEGVEWDPVESRFLVTSLTQGVVGEVKDDGSYRPFAEHDEMISAIGLAIDVKRDRMLVCNSDPGVSIHSSEKTKGKLAGLAFFRLSDGKFLKHIRLDNLHPGDHFANDVAVDEKGNAYITDSFSPVIYKVTNSGKASILLEDKRFTGNGFNLNGIVYHSNGYLIVAKYNEGVLFKIPIENPRNFSQVKIDLTLLGADGLVLSPDGTLTVIANEASEREQTNKIFTLSSEDDWLSAKIVCATNTGRVFATTGTVRDVQVYVLNSMLHRLFNPEVKTPETSFEIWKVRCQ